MKKILLAVDFSASSMAAVDAVLAQFPPGDTEVRLFHAFDWEQQLPGSFLFAEGPHAAETLLIERERIARVLQARLDVIKERFVAERFAVSTRLEAAERPATAILQAASEWPADLVVIGSQGRSGMARVVLGSVAEGVMRRAPCAVQVVRPVRDTETTGESEAQREHPIGLRR